MRGISFITNKIDVDDNLEQWFCKVKNVITVFKTIFSKFCNELSMKNLLE